MLPYRDEVQLTLRVSHTNESSLEANDPKLRLLMPKYMSYTDNSYTPNITGTPAFNKYLDITVSFGVICGKCYLRNL